MKTMASPSERDKEIEEEGVETEGVETGDVFQGPHNWRRTLKPVRSPEKEEIHLSESPRDR